MGWANDNGCVDSRIVEHRERIGVPARHVQLVRCFFSEFGIRVRQSREAHACDACRKVTRVYAPEPAKPNQAHIQLHLFLLDIFTVVRVARASACGVSYLLEPKPHRLKPVPLKPASARSFTSLPVPYSLRREKSGLEAHRFLAMEFKPAR